MWMRNMNLIFSLNKRKLINSLINKDINFFLKKRWAITEDNLCNFLSPDMEVLLEHERCMIRLNQMMYDKACPLIATWKNKV